MLIGQLHEAEGGPQAHRQELSRELAPSPAKGTPPPRTVSGSEQICRTACGKLRPGLCYFPRKYSLFDELGSSRHVYSDKN